MKWLISGWFLLLVTVTSCSKTTSLKPLPPTQSDPSGPEYFPMSDYMGTLSQNNGAPEWYAQFSGILNWQGDETTKLAGIEYGYTFRSSAAGRIVAIGLYLPSGGYYHEVQLWDSATQEVLAQQRIPCEDGEYIYSTLTTPVHIKPHHGYIVTATNYVEGVGLQSGNPGEAIFMNQGIYADGALEAFPWFPAQDGPITIEGWNYLQTDTVKLATQPFPGGIQYNGTDVITTFQGFVDVQFIQGS